MTTTSPVSLAVLYPGACGTIASVACPAPLRRRLMDMGLTPGTVICLERAAPLGDPIIVHVRGCRLGLRRVEAAGIMVNPVPHTGLTPGRGLRRRERRRGR